MSDLLKHECGIALIRLRQPLDYYQEKYGNLLYGFQQLFLLMEKQHNRGQDGAGIGCVKMDMPPGEAFMFRERDNGRNPIATIMRKAMKEYHRLIKANAMYPEFPQTVKALWPFAGEVLMGHLRYGTSGGYSKSVCQPYFRKSPWPTRNLMMAGNFNMTNLDHLNRTLIRRGAHPIFNTDTQTVLEEIGFHLDEEHQRLYRKLRKDHPSDQIAAEISAHMDLPAVLRAACDEWDGGYALAGLIGNGDAFVLRDPLGIRPAFYFENDEVVAVASERVALMTIFDQSEDAINEVPPGHAIWMRHNDTVSCDEIRKPGQRAACSFERIYFSRGNDPDIYRERKALGAALADDILRTIEGAVAKSVFSFIPNTAEIAYFGLLDELHARHHAQIKERILDKQNNGGLTSAFLDALFNEGWPRSEKIAHKDIKLRTFISQESSRVQLASHVYDITYGQVTPDQNLVCIDDSIVRGTTLKQSILRILGNLNPQRIIIASTAPQIRYPDCYGIDMSELGKFIAFQAAVALLEESGKGELLQEVYADCVNQVSREDGKMVNHVKRIYEPFSATEISRKISELVYPHHSAWQGELQIIYQSIENLHNCCPNNRGDWYFTGDYPTAGGVRVVNRAYINYYQKKSGRSY